MRYWIIPALVLVVGIVSLSRADYVIVRVTVKSGTGAPVGMGNGMMGNGLGGAFNNMGNQGGGAMGMPPMPPPALKPGEYVTAVFEMKGSKQENYKGLSILYLEHKWGRTAYHEDRDEIVLQRIEKLKNPVAQYNDRVALLGKAKDRGPDRQLELAAWCLEVGLPDKCIEKLNEIEKTAAAAKDPAPLPEKVIKALEAYQKIKPILSDELTHKEKATEWKGKLRFASLVSSKHYALVHNSDDPERDGVQRRLDALENNFKIFYLLFAMKGKVLAAPTEKLVAVLVNDSGIFRKLRQTFDPLPLSSDGFYARQENLAVFSSVRIDEASRGFDQMMRVVYTNNSTDLLSGKFPDLGKTKEEMVSRATQTARAQMLALVERALREESEIAAATHEGAMQLYAETGLLPRNTAAPEWLRFGLASLFQMPKGPFAGKNTSLVQLAFWPGAGGPNWAWRRYIDEMLQDGALADPPNQAISDILIDQPFIHSRALALKPKMEGAEDPIAASEAELARGRALSWALSYYLFNDKFPDFMSYLANLANQPRDIEFDPYIPLQLFCKWFNIDPAGLTPADLSAKPERYTEFAKDWLAGIRRVPAPTVLLRLDEPVDPKGKKQ